MNDPAIVRSARRLRLLVAVGIVLIVAIYVLGRLVPALGPIRVEAHSESGGLKKGDRLIDVDGLKVGTGFFSSDRSGWAKAPAGTKVQLTKSDGVSVTLTLADYY